MARLYFPCPRLWKSGSEKDRSFSYVGFPPKSALPWVSLCPSLCTIFRPALVHPALLLPHAFATSSCLASVLQLLAGYWQPMQAQQPVFGQVRAALAASGLATVPHFGSFLSAPGLGAPGQLRSVSPHDSLCVQLLRTLPQGGEGMATAGTGVGTALAALCMQTVEQGDFSPSWGLNEVSASLAGVCPQHLLACSHNLSQTFEFLFGLACHVSRSRYSPPCLIHCSICLCPFPCLGLLDGPVIVSARIAACSIPAVPGRPCT